MRAEYMPANHSTISTSAPSMHSTIRPVEVVFITETIENVPDGWRARETYLIEGPDEFVERFELAAPGKDFDLYSENRLRRAGVS